MQKEFKKQKIHGSLTLNMKVNFAIVGRTESQLPVSVTARQSRAFQQYLLSIWIFRLGNWIIVSMNTITKERYRHYHISQVPLKSVQLKRDRYISLYNFEYKQIMLTTNTNYTLSIQWFHWQILHCCIQFQSECKIEPIFRFENDQAKTYNFRFSYSPFCHVFLVTNIDV